MLPESAPAVAAEAAPLTPLQKEPCWCWHPVPARPRAGAAKLRAWAPGGAPPKTAAARHAVARMMTEAETCPASCRVVLRNRCGPWQGQAFGLGLCYSCPSIETALFRTRRFKVPDVSHNQS